MISFKEMAISLNLPDPATLHSSSIRRLVMALGIASEFISDQDWSGVDWYLRTAREELARREQSNTCS